MLLTCKCLLGFSSGDPARGGGRWQRDARLGEAGHGCLQSRRQPRQGESSFVEAVFIVCIFYIWKKW